MTVYDPPSGMANGYQWGSLPVVLAASWTGKVQVDAADAVHELVVELRNRHLNREPV
jgi:hypothetical protein